MNMKKIGGLNKMTNQQIVAAYKREQNIPLDTPLYTYGAWYKMGYRVKKKKKCRHRVQLWKMGQKKDDEGNIVNTGKCFHKIMHLFDETQVTKM